MFSLLLALQVLAELPRSTPVVPAHLAASACTVTVPAGGLQAALNSAKAPAVLCLVGTHSGAFTLPARADTGWVVVRSLVKVVPPGQRMRPTLALPAAKILSASGASNAALKTAPKAARWYLAELEFSSATAKQITAGIVSIVAPPDSLSWATDIVLDRVYIHGLPTQNVSRCLLLEGKAVTVINSWLDECHGKGYDSQAIASWSGMGPFLIENNYLAGAGENVLFGGAQPRFRTVPSDITFRRNHVQTPPSWKTTWTKKNVFETKAVRRLLVEANVFDGSWPDAQVGYAILVKSSNQKQSSGLPGRCTWCGTYDATFRKNLIVNAAGAFQPNGQGGGLPIDSVTDRVVYSQNYAEITGQLPWGYETRGTMILSGIKNLTMQHNTTVTPAGRGADYTTGTGASLPVNWTLTDNVGIKGQYMTLNCRTATCAPGLFRTGNLVVGSPSSAAPSGFAFVPTLTSALATGAGVLRVTVENATVGVVVAR